jgi:hypothetical protein
MCIAAAVAVPTVSYLQVDCAVGAWSGWSECDATTGRKERTRSIVALPSSDGNPCPAVDDAPDCLGELHDAAAKGDLAAVEARPRSHAANVLRPVTT